MLAAGLLGVEVLGSVACWVLVALGFRHAGFVLPALALPILGRRHRGRLAPRRRLRADRGRARGRTVGMADDVARTDLFIGGEWRPAASGERFDVVDPGTEEVIATVANAGAADARAPRPRRPPTPSPAGPPPPRGSGPRCCGARGSCSPSGPTTWPA